MNQLMEMRIIEALEGIHKQLQYIKEKLVTDPIVALESKRTDCCGKPQDKSIYQYLCHACHCRLMFDNDRVAIENGWVVVWEDRWTCPVCTKKRLLILDKGEDIDDCPF